MVAGLRGDPNDLETKAQLVMSSPPKGAWPPGGCRECRPLARDDEAGYTSGHTLTTDAGLTIEQGGL